MLALRHDKRKLVCNQVNYNQYFHKMHINNHFLLHKLHLNFTNYNQYFYYAYIHIVLKAYQDSTPLYITQTQKVLSESPKHFYNSWTIAYPSKNYNQYLNYNKKDHKFKLTKIAQQNFQVVYCISMKKLNDAIDVPIWRNAQHF